MGSGRRGGDRVLESRHLVGLFLGVVLLCGVFFTLGYVMGRTQYDTSVHASDVSPLEHGISARNSTKSLAAKASAGPAASEWDFYAKKADDNRLESAAKPAASRSVAPSPRAIRVQERRDEAKLPSHVRPPRMLKNAIVLQVAALRHQGDALALADAIQQKHFPSFVVTPTTDAYYRVQVGPYSSEGAAERARRQLDHQGFKSIIKR